MKINDEVKMLFDIPLADEGLTEQHKSIIHSIASKCKLTKCYKEYINRDEQVNMIDELSDIQIYRYIYDRYRFSKSELEIYITIRLMIPTLSYKLMSMQNG